MKLNVSGPRVKIWFQNRRVKWRKHELSQNFNNTFSSFIQSKNLLNSSATSYSSIGSPQNDYSYMLNLHDNQLFKAPMRTQKCSAPLANKSPPMFRDYSMLQPHLPSVDDNSIGVKIEYVNHSLNGSSERYINMSSKYEGDLMQEVKQNEFETRIKESIKLEPKEN